VSLLIDALKKAEQEKKEAAKRLKEAQEKTGEQIKLESDDQVDLKTSGQSATSSRVKSGDIEPGPSTEKKSTSELSLSPLNEKTVEHKPGPELSNTDPGAEQKEPHSLHLEDVTIEHDGFDSPDENDLVEGKKVATNLDQTFALTDLGVDDDSTPPFDDSLGDNTLKDNLANTLSDSRSFKSVVSAAELAKDMGGGRGAPTPVAAQTVFTAVGGTSGKRQILEWTLFLGLFAAVIIAAGTFYYLKVTPLTPEVSSPLVAQGVEIDASEPFIVPLPVEDSIAPTPEITTLPETVTETTSEILAEEVAVPEQPVVDESMPEQVAIAEPEVEVSKPTEMKIVEEPARVVAEESHVLPEKIQVDQSVIAISRTKSVDKKDQLINTAYNEYNKGNYTVAEAAYQGVLKDMPENRDALLGLAAIAWRKGNIQNAYEYYLKVLKLYPRDTVAATGIISLQDYTDPLRSESTIKLMLREQPDAAFLHFALGNNYASQSRWPEAQQAFFEAYRLQSDNPDYAYNLAVSLDQIGQARPAMEYYRKALELADATQVSFNTASVLARVNDLSTNFR